MECTNKLGLFRVAWGAAATLLVGGLLGACAATPMPPTSDMTKARDAISIAQASGARQYAPAELDDAQQHLEQAEAAVAAEEMLAAERSAHRARVTAELATARTEATKATDINHEMQQAAKALREEMKRTGEQQ